MTQWFASPSLITRIAVGKTIGFIIGVVAFFMIPLFAPDINLAFRFGLLFYYTTIGAFIGLAGVLDYHPILKLPLPWWFRGAFYGAWFYLLALLLNEALFQQILVPFGGLSPFWLLLEGAAIGLIIDYTATRLGGEGKACLS